MSIMDRTRTTLTTIFAEAETWVLPFALTKPGGIPLPAGELSALTMFLYNDDADHTPINMGTPTPTKRNVLNVNGGTVDANCNVTIELGTDDGVLVDITVADYEWHVALIEWEWDAGARSSAHEFRFRVRNMRHRPAIETPPGP